jgi:DnaK suppressor protein
MSERGDIDLEALRARLIAQREEAARLSESSREARQPVELDQQSVGRLSRMDALQGQAMAQATEQRRLNEAKRIEAALRRMDDGDFGYCLRCGEEIQAKRLDFDPAAPLCVACASAG